MISPPRLEARRAVVLSKVACVACAAAVALASGTSRAQAPAAVPDTSAPQATPSATSAPPASAVPASAPPAPPAPSVASPPAPSPAPSGAEGPEGARVLPPQAVAVAPPDAGFDGARHLGGARHGRSAARHGHGCCADGGHRRLSFGGMGYASAGLMSGEFSALQSSLTQPNVFGIGYDAAPAGLLFGGGGGLFYERFWLGGKGFGMFASTSATDHGTSTLTGGGGGFELGYAVMSSDRWLVVPFFGLGGFGYGLSVTNSSSNALNIYPNETIPAGAEQAYTAGFFTGEVGLRANRLLVAPSLGLTIGAELGYMASLQRAAWESASGNSSRESAELRGAYFRLLVGAAGFSYHDGHGAHDGERD